MISKMCIVGYTKIIHRVLSKVLHLDLNNFLLLNGIIISYSSFPFDTVLTIVLKFL